MAQIFHKSFNSLAKVSIVAGGLLGVTAVSYAALLFNRAPFVTEVQLAKEQPVQFSHDHHVGGLGIDCRVCHTTVEVAARAGVPPTKTCMSCHSQVWKDSPMLEPVRQSYRDDVSLPWVRVHDLPDFVYFDHSIHLKKGVACESCHGRVDKMPLMWRENTLNMEWCLACHRDPVPHLRPREALFEMGWKDKYFEAQRHVNNPDGSHPDDIEIARRLRTMQEGLQTEYAVHPQINCSICHR